MSTSTAPPVSPYDPADPPGPFDDAAENEASRSLSGLAAAITAFGAVVVSFADVWGLIRERVSAAGYAGYGLLAVILVVGLIATAVAHRRLLRIELPGTLGGALGVAFAAALAGLFVLGTVDEHDRRNAAAAAEARETCHHAASSRVLGPFPSLPLPDRPASQPDGSECLVEGDLTVAIKCEKRLIEGLTALLNSLLHRRSHHRRHRVLFSSRHRRYRRNLGLLHRGLPRDLRRFPHGSRNCRRRRLPRTYRKKTQHTRRQAQRRQSGNPGPVSRSLGRRLNLPLFRWRQRRPRKLRRGSICRYRRAR